MAGVPDTNTFSLQDVVDVIPGVQSGLQGCFTDALDGYFDQNYGGPNYLGVGTGYDRLSNFRNYGGDLSYYFGFESTNEGWLDKTGSVWADVRGASYADSVNTDTGDFQVTVEKDSSDDYIIERTFLTFDLSAIPSGATCVAAVIGMRVTTTHGASNFEPNLVLGSQGVTLATDDFNDFSTTTLATTWATVDTNIFEYAVYGFTNQLTASSGQRTEIESHFGSRMDTVLMNLNYDFFNSAPSTQAKYGISIHKAGEFFGGPVLYIEYTI